MEDKTAGSRMGALTTSDLDFVDDFERCVLPKAKWTHEAHVRMAWIQFARAGSFREGLEKIREGIQRFNASVASQGYHETVTVAFSHLVFFRLLHGRKDQTWDEFRSQNSDLLAKAPSPLSSYYSRTCLESAESKSAFVLPDLRPLPRPGLVRAASESDATEIASIYAPYVSATAVSFEQVPPSPAEMAQRIREIAAHAPWLVYEVDGKIAGYAYASRHRARPAYQWAVEVSAYIGGEFKRQGIGRLLYTRLFDALDQQGFHLALAGITLPNPASVGLHESMGFSPIGVYSGVGFKMGRWHDVGWWERRLKPLSETPGPLLPPAGLDDGIRV